MSVQQIMTADETGELLVAYATEKGRELANAGLGLTQIRLVFNEARRIETLWATNQTDALRRLNMLKPKLAYQTKRKKEVAGLEKILVEAIDEVNRAKDEETRNKRFSRFMNFFEAIVAYHKVNDKKG